jgi:hypothetical protein
VARSAQLNTSSSDCGRSEKAILTLVSGGDTRVSRSPLTWSTRFATFASVIGLLYYRGASKASYSSHDSGPCAPAQPQSLPYIYDVRLSLLCRESAEHRLGRCLARFKNSHRSGPPNELHILVKTFDDPTSDKDDQEMAYLESRGMSCSHSIISRRGFKGRAPLKFCAAALGGREKRLDAPVC